MNITRYDPFRELRGLQNEMNRVFGGIVPTGWDNVLTLKGERKFEKKDDGDNYHRIERAYGSFTRSFTLPSTVSAEGAKAEFNNGVLNVTLPKREETKARKIEITGADTGSTPKTIETESRSSTANA